MTETESAAAATRPQRHRTECSGPRPARPLFFARFIGLLLLLALLLAALYGSLLFGSNELTSRDLWMNLLNRDPSSTLYNIVWLSRVPRTLVLGVAGAALGVAGAVMHAATRNPLTDPGILGVNAGASFAVVIGIIVFHQTSIAHYRWNAFIGALIASFIVFLVGESGRKGKADPVRLTLTGVAFAAVLSGVTQMLLLTNNNAYYQMRGWSAGTVVGRPTNAALEIAPLVVTGLALAMISWKGLDAMALGEPTAIALGFNPKRVRLISLVSIALLAGAATAAVGPIAFIGLLASHVARAITGPHQGWITAYALVVAPLILTLADVLGRIGARGEIPVGIVTPVLGAPLLVFIARKMRVMTR